MAAILVTEEGEVAQEDLAEEVEEEEEDLVHERLPIEMIHRLLHRLIVSTDQLIHGPAMKSNSILPKSQRWVSFFHVR